MNRRTYILLLWLISLLPVGILRTRADVIYTSFIGGVYDPSSVHSIFWRNDSSPVIREGIGLAAPFTVPIGLEYRLDSVTLALAHASGAVNLEIMLLADNNGSPGELLEMLAINPTITAGLALPYEFTSALEPILSGGETYWLLAQPHELNVTNQTQNALYDWAINFNQVSGPVAHHIFDFEANGWRPSWDVRTSFVPAFQIEGTLVPVPEPSTWALLALGSAAFFATRRRRK